MMGYKNTSKYKGERWIGKKYNMLTVIGEAYKDNTNTFAWPMKCDCGNEISVRIANVINGHTTSCGCYKQKRISDTRKHGMANSRLYHIHQQMIRRCKKGNKASKHYADRGITICDEWKKFEVFKDWAYENGYTDSLSIERIDVNGNYCPENCKWIPRNLQTRNTRMTYLVNFQGRKMSLSEACEIAGLPYKSVFARVSQLGWDVEKALSVPINGTRGKYEFKHICKRCGKEFICNNAKTKYCSDKCKREIENLRRRKSSFCADKNHEKR